MSPSNKHLEDIVEKLAYRLNQGRQSPLRALFSYTISELASLPMRILLLLAGLSAAFLVGAIAFLRWAGAEGPDEYLVLAGMISTAAFWYLAQERSLWLGSLLSIGALLWVLRF